ncbi:MAG TPA: hypothetical protein VJ749_08390 [Pyrinomonadaceae bacterium]|jgi:hypothetical protein|nr:hypothetical protein [Pyrinomonadaceae bacterium]
MGKFVLVCLLMSGAVLPPAPVRAQRAVSDESPFVLAERFGEASANERTFFLFSTSMAKYILRHDGTGEATSRAGLRKAFYLKVGARERIERVYSLEYEGDLLLLYQAGETGYVARMNQHSRKVRTVTIAPDFAPPTIKDHRLVFSDGATVSLD